MDSGTSLLMLPTNAIDKLLEAVSKLNSNCTNLDELPHFAFQLDGQQFTLPPDSYIAEAIDDEKVNATVPESLVGFARIRTWQRPGYVRQLMVMEGNTRSQYGQTWILGMPFFRQYYSTFDLGDTREDRALYVAPAKRDCTPLTSEDAKDVSLVHEGAIRRRIDPRKVLAPRAPNVTMLV